MALYLDACLDDDSGDGKLVPAVLNDVARARGMSRDTSLTREGIQRALFASGNPEFSTMLQVIAALGMKLHAVPANSAKPPKASRNEGVKT